MDQSQARPERVPVILVTGYLGSGKTTLVNSLLQTQAFARAAVVVNEYGEVSIDHALVQAPRWRMRVIDSGCLCGHVHEEVASSLLDLDEKRRKRPDLDYDFVLVEMSGLADPVPVIQILTTDPHVTTLYELRTVLTVADGVHGSGHLDGNRESVKQAAVADTMIISKTDLAEPAAIAALAGRLAGINPGARQLLCANGEIDPHSILEQSTFDVADRSATARQWLQDRSYSARVAPASADPEIATFSLVFDDEISVTGLVLWLNLLAGFRGAGLLRVKGIVNVESRPYAVQAVQTIVSEPVPLEVWPDEDHRTRLVFITRGMRADDIKRTLSTFRFEGAGAGRNLPIDPATYARFRDTIQLFRTSPEPPSRPPRPGYTPDLELQ